MNISALDGAPGFDGKHFLVNCAVEPPGPFVVLLNWPLTTNSQGQCRSLNLEGLASLSPTIDAGRQFHQPSLDRAGLRLVKGLKANGVHVHVRAHDAVEGMAIHT